MSKDILSVIQTNMSTFSKGQKRIADYILQNYDKAAFMTASKLGKLSGVSESTVVRFASELGYDGYPSMQRALQEMIRSRLTSTQRIQAADNLFGGQDVLSAVIQSDMDKLRMVAEEEDIKQSLAILLSTAPGERVHRFDFGCAFRLRPGARKTEMEAGKLFQTLLRLDDVAPGY